MKLALKILKLTEAFNEREDFRCWISPFGEVIVVPDHHIDAILRNPQAFGFSQEDIEGYTRKDDREQLIVRAVLQGWIRVRYYAKKQKWILNIQRVTKRTVDVITNFFDRRFRDQKSYAEVTIDHPLGVENTSVNDIVGFDLYRLVEKKKGRKAKIKGFFSEVVN